MTGTPDSAPPTQVDTVPAPLNAGQTALIDEAATGLDEGWMTALLARLVEIPSPFGEEAAIARFLAETMAAAGLDSEVQEIDDHSANAIGRLRGMGEGPELMIFAPLDSPFTGRAADEVPWVGETLPAHMKPEAIVADGGVTGLSADNPKAHIVSAIAAAGALAAVGPDFKGSLTLAFGAGGAPANARPDQGGRRVGHGRGCAFMLANGLAPDFAIVAKPGYRVAWEEVGLCWFRIRVRGVQTYVGRRHFLAYRNPIVEAAPLITALEAWFADYAARHTDGLVAPQGAIGAIAGGWPYKPAFTPAACDLYVDLRISPRTPPEAARDELVAEIARVAAANPGLEADCDMIVAIPGGATDPGNWIVQSCIRAWEAVEGERHAPYLETSGQTEAVILRNAGIPTARFGLPAVMTAGAAPPAHSMGQVKSADMARFTRCLIYSIVDTCSRDRAATGL